MKNAADLLQDAEKKTDAMLNRAEQILHTTQELTGKCGEIVKTLSDFSQNFGEIQAENKRIEDGIKRLINKIQTVARESKTRQYITMGFVILTFAVFLSILIKTFL